MSTNNYIKINGKPVAFFDDSRPSSVQRALDHVTPLGGRLCFYRAFKTNQPIQGCDVVGIESPTMLRAALRIARSQSGDNAQDEADAIEKRIPLAEVALNLAWGLPAKEALA